MGLLGDLWSDYTLRTVALGAAVLGVVAGALGSFAILRRQSLLGDAISHAALPGIALAFLVTGSKSPLVLVAGAALAGWLSTLLVVAIVRTTRIKSDAALGLVLSVFFGAGLVLLTFIQRRPDATQAGLDKFLFGQAAALVERDVWTMAAIGAVALAVVALLWKELKLLAFDPDFGATNGFAMRALDVVLTSMLVVAIVIGLQTVGVVLMSALVVAPGAAARQWTDRLGVMVVLAALFGAASGVAGALLSSSTAALPTGPTIVLCAGAIVVTSLLAAPNRGLVWNRVRDVRARRRLHVDAVLADLLALSSQHEREHAHHASVVETMAAGRPGVRHGLEQLAARGLARATPDDRWALTPAGVEAARRAAAERDGAGSP
ncbi:MAG TPA: metal ABC transporter permease [Actinomycetota bacterium]|nr:metal ABC transporter permease [Actinomycetota bacterium]